MVSAPSVGGISGSGGAGPSSASAGVRGPPTTAASATLCASGNAKPAQVYANGYHPAKTQNPLSSMISPPLDLTSVERREQPTFKEPVKKKSRPHGLQEAPTYYPTEEEWKEPFEFIQKIAPEAREYGLCKIVPPESWNPDFAIDTKRFHFRTRKQELNSIEGSSRANLTYLDALGKFHKQQGTNLTRWPYVDKKPLDLYRLKKAVEARGGFEKVCKLKKWAEIGRDLGYSGKIMSSLSTSLKNSYQKWLCPYEDYLRIAKPGVHQQLELEYGGPLTPSPAPSPMKRTNVNTPFSLRAESPARHATDALQATMNSHTKDADRDFSMEEASPFAAPQAPGFTAINNSGGFTAVNSGFTSVNRPPTGNPDMKAPKTSSTPLSSSKNTPESRPSGLTVLKRQLSGDNQDTDAGTDKDDGESGSRRSKRLKKDAVPTIAGSHMSLFRPSAPRIPKDEVFSPGEMCEHCGKGGEEHGALLICESCDHGYHGSCLDPPVRSKPDTEWNCPRCLVGDGQFGFEEGGLYSLKQFQEKAADFKQAYFESKMPFDPVLDCHRPVTEDDVEREFWRLVADLEETVEVEYGADIHCTTHGSGFPTIEKNPENPYSTDPWNLNLLPLHPDSLFRHIKSDISGMTVPWVYVGMIFSTFCWHNEDHYAYSANYQHFGATKTWYGIPGDDAEKFEKAMREAVPELFETQPDLLFQLVTLLTPEQLKKAGVRVYALDQRAGQFVITFPQAYHAGFNHGFNFNEAVNFAPSDWEPYGLAGVERLQQFRRQPCFSHDELLWTAAEGITGAGLTIQTAKWLAPALERIHRRELGQRDEFVAKHDFIAKHLDAKRPAQTHACVFNGASGDECPMTFKVDDVDVPEEEYGCFYCKSFTYLSRFICLKTGKVLCLLHAGSHPCCGSQESDRYLGKDHALYYRKSGEVVANTFKKVSDKAHLPEAWEEKYEKLLDEEATPSLKSLRTLLSEGEKIPHDLPSLPILKTFVDRCNHWVEEATNYTVRKQQVRRKNEKAWLTGARKSIGGTSQEQKEWEETRNASNIYRLLDEAELIGFDCPEILQLKERADAIKAFQESARQTLTHRTNQSIDVVEELLEEGQSFNVDIPEVQKLSAVLDQLKWNEKAKVSRGVFMTLKDVNDLIEEGEALKIPLYNDHLSFYKDQLIAGQIWEKKAQELINADVVNYAQLQALSDQAQASALPVSPETLAAVDQILHKQREASRQIMDLNERSRRPDYHERPKYAEVLEVIKKIEELQAKPTGTLDLEREQKRHEDWMRKGKKLFGKTNAPLHILKSHMDYVLDRNIECFNIVTDKPRVPAEPASREPSPERRKSNNWEDPQFREVFCICRRTEAGMMIECELCHEWYHGKCLKIARGKVKEDDKYTCPICDWRVKIPRDAARPKLEDLISWFEEIEGLPFQPDEEEVLKKIIDNAQEFRNQIGSYCNPVLATANEAETQRFYLRKIEGAEILLAFETNFFRQELHKWSPVAPEAPPVLESSKSTRKPRPTKLQKMLIQYGVDDPDDLPESVKGKANSLKRKALNAEAAAAMSSTHSGGGMETSPGANPYGPSGVPFFSQHSPGQLQTPGLTIASNSHGHPSRGPGPSSSSHGHHRRSDSNQGNGIDLESGSIHPSFFMQNNGGGGPHLLVGDNSTHSLEERLLRDTHYGGEDLNMDLTTEAGKTRALEILSRTDVGRRRAEEIFGRDVWGGSTDDNDPIGIGVGPEGDDNIFIDLMIEDDDDERKVRDSSNDGHHPEDDRNEAASLMDAQKEA
ncbi:PLU-1-like protein-domain-containing protein [Lasiosphaeria miniovina]|uniref:PLU-1-like protein-domain-containing protein n=1 Tax=Lasiosphaeria miniovina TaxID=1954250 RepID=A0AA40E5D4_9PEZI|nr:PLU-1-like protein-domain-containing protein [Lasiosphaeria miniovina]KAK0727760.1 PLU-1-like protein-domain-containing protein [Lasiosphaeria miniovina]